VGDLLTSQARFSSQGLAKKMHKPSQGSRQHVLEAFGFLKLSASKSIIEINVVNERLKILKLMR